jgi:hypothetical protein
MVIHYWHCRPMEDYFVKKTYNTYLTWASCYPR